MNRPSSPPDKLARLQKQFAAHIRNPDEIAGPGDVEDRRMAIYRELFFNNIQGFLSSNFPVIRKLYDDPDWLKLVREFFVHHQSQTPLFPELPREFLRYLQDERPGQAGDPPFLFELAHYEWVELALSLDAADFDDTAHDPDGDLLSGRPLVSPLAWPFSYRFPVHRIRPDFQPTEAPDNPTHLLVYRNREERVQFMELNAVSALLLHKLKGNENLTGLDCLNAIAEELDHPQPGVVVDGGRQQMEVFRSRDIILGTRV